MKDLLKDMKTHDRQISQRNCIGASVFMACGLQWEIEQRYPALSKADRITAFFGAKLLRLA